MSTDKKYALKEYGIAAGLMAMAVYQILKPDYWEVALYMLAGSSFALMGLIKDGYFSKHKSLADTISWVLIVFTGIFFLYMVVTDT